MREMSIQDQHEMLTTHLQMGFRVGMAKKSDPKRVIAELDASTDDAYVTVGGPESDEKGEYQQWEKIKA